MQLWRSWDDVPDDLGRTAAVIGNFDGVHLGHRRVLARARAVADERDLLLVAVTFDPHPMAVLRPEHAPTSLTSLETRAELLAGAGAEVTITGRRAARQNNSISPMISTPASRAA